MKIGIVYYAHAASRNIAMQMSELGFDYFGCGTLSQPTGKIIIKKMHTKL